MNCAQLDSLLQAETALNNAKAACSLRCVDWFDHLLPRIDSSVVFDVTLLALVTARSDRTRLLRELRVSSELWEKFLSDPATFRHDVMTTN